MKTTLPSRRRAGLPRAAVLLLALAAAPAAAQDAPRGAEATPSGRMRAFLEAVEVGNTARTASFFPRRGDWEWRQSLHGTRGVRQVATWRFRGAETERAIRFGGPACRIVRCACRRTRASRGFAR